MARRLRTVLLSQMGEHHKTSKVKASGEDALLETRQCLTAHFWCWAAPTEPLTWATSGRASITPGDFSSPLELPWLISLLRDNGLAHQQGTDRKGKFRCSGVMAESSCPAPVSNHLILLRHTYPTIKLKMIRVSDTSLQFSAVMLHGSTIKLAMETHAVPDPILFSLC